jgi:hypothetical protein
VDTKIVEGADAAAEPRDHDRLVEQRDPDGAVAELVGVEHGMPVVPERLVEDLLARPVELVHVAAGSGTTSSQPSAAQIVSRKKRRKPSWPSRLNANGHGSQKATGAS